MNIVRRPVLIGRLLSPFVRRTAVSLTYLGVDFERKVLSAIDADPLSQD